MTTLAEFLLARLAEDEAVAHRVIARTEYEPPKNIGGIPRLGIVGYPAARVLAECEAKRLLIADLTAERHEVVEDCWYTCAAATEEHDGGNCCDDSRGVSCDCGRDNRVARRLGILALPYVDRDDYDESWRP